MKVDPIYSIVVLIVVSFLSCISGIRIERGHDAAIIRHESCLRGGAALVADTLCVRPDSSWKVSIQH